MIGDPAMNSFRARARPALIALALLIANAGALPAADAPKPKVTLSPEKEARLAEALKKAGESKRKFWTERMKREIERVTKATGLDANGGNALEDAAGQATDACLGGWSTAVGESWRQYAGMLDDDGLVLDQLADQSVQADWSGDYLRPFEHALWEGALRRTLSADQFAAWEKIEKARREAVAKETAELLKAAVDRACDEQRRLLIAKGAAIKSSLALSKERAAKLDELATTATATAGDGLRSRAGVMFLRLEDDQRKAMLKSRQFYLGLEVKDLEVQHATWTEGLAALLSPEEKKQLETATERYKTKRVAVIARVLIAELDDRIAFNASQRERLQPIAERLVKDDQPALIPDNAMERIYRIDPQVLFTAGAKATAVEMEAILDARQWQRWQEACLAKNQRRVRVGSAVKKSGPGAALPKAAPVPEPEEVENAFSDYLHEKASGERQRLLAIHLLKAEDAARVAGLAPDAAGRLATAARGVTEVALAAWAATTESSVRSQARDVTPQNVRQRLAAMESYTFSSRSSGGTATAPIWEKAMKAELTEAGRAAWEKELAARIAYRDSAIAAVIMSEFDRKIPLEAEEWTKLEPLIARAVKDYAPDIAMMFSSTTPWYLQSYSMFIPFAAVPEKELKGILKKDQWDRWVTSEENGNTANYWENVQRYHTQRVKEKK